MSNNNSNQLKFQVNPLDNPATETNNFQFADMRLVCDECCLPIHLYGENFIETYTDGKVNTLRVLCDLHAEEFYSLEVSE